MEIKFSREDIESGYAVEFLKKITGEKLQLHGVDGGIAPVETAIIPELPVMNEPEQAEVAKPQVNTTPRLDKNGLPWDERIHSETKATNKDETWRYKRAPKDKSKDEWEKFIQGVEAELRALMAIPVQQPAPTTIPEVPAPAIVPEVPKNDEGFGDVPKKLDLITDVMSAVLKLNACGKDVAEKELARMYSTLKANTLAEVLPVHYKMLIEEINRTIDRVQAEQRSSETYNDKNFMDLLNLYTNNVTKISPDAVTEICQGFGIASLSLVQNRPDLVPQIYAKMKAAVDAA